MSDKPDNERTMQDKLNDFSYIYLKEAELVASIMKDAQYCNDESPSINDAIKNMKKVFDKSFALKNCWSK